MDYSNIIDILLPDSKYIIINNDYSTFVWDNDNTSLKPTEGEILNKQTEIFYECSYMLLREERNKLLINSDKYVLLDYPHNNDTIKNAWLDYRQNLRDITKNQIPSLDLNGDLITITWPTKPS